MGVPPDSVIVEILVLTADDGSAILSQTPEEVTTILKLQMDTSRKMHGIAEKMAALELSAENYRSTADELGELLESIKTFVDPSEQLQEIKQGVGSISRRLTGMLSACVFCNS